MQASFEFITTQQGRQIAYRRREGKKPGIIFFSGFKSDMGGTKASAIDAWCERNGHSYIRFDYSGHGQSSGVFEEGCIGAWKEDALAVIDQLTQEPQLFIGSSMGAWIALLCARERPAAISGLIGLAPAPDFTERLIWQAFTDEQKNELQQNGVVYLPSCYGEEPYGITRKLLEEGRNHLLLDEPLNIHCPTVLLHGMKDVDVPWNISLKLIEIMPHSEARLTLIKNGDHRLSSPEHLHLLNATIEDMVRRLAV